MTLQQLLNRIDSVKTKLDSARPLSASELSQLLEYYKIGLTYTSNALADYTRMINLTAPRA